MGTKKKTPSRDLAIIHSTLLPDGRKRCLSDTSSGHVCPNAADPQDGDPPMCRTHTNIARDSYFYGNKGNKCHWMSEKTGRECKSFAMKNSKPPMCIKHSDDREGMLRERKRRKAKRVTGNIRMQKLITGEMDVSELDDEELVKGYPRADSGRFSPNPPQIIPRVMYDRMINELFNRADQKMRENLLEVVETLTNLATNPEVEPKDRLKAAQFIFERLRGKTPVQVSVASGKPYEAILERISAGPRKDSKASKVDSPTEEEEPLDVEFEEGE